ncbi:MAG: glycosyltransferase family 9 protein [Epsilonproteobacteria bacterium]|nr:glycosyltransferase family 9 protein [Campylobacterota bacterium]
MIDLNNKKILLVRNDNVGDLICTTPVIEALRKKYPHAQIDIVVNSYNYIAINYNPFIDNIYCYTKPKHESTLLKKIKAGVKKIKILYKIKREKYNVVVVFRSGYSKSAELFSNITNAQYKVGVKSPNNKDNFNIHIKTDNSVHEVDFCYNCLNRFMVKKGKEKTFFYLRDKFRKKHNNFNDIVLFHISARMKKNQMSFGKLKKILTKLNIPIYLTSEPKDFKMASKLAKETSAIFVKTDSFLNLGGIISKSKLFVTLEGGAMHLAPAIGIKTLALFGVSDISKWHPWGYKDLVLQDKSKVAENINEDLIVKKIMENI